MKILPPQTQPPRTPTARRHGPAATSHWSGYRSCLRWDFGFTCAFCLLHETDLYGGFPGEGLAGTTAEHRIPRSADPGRANDYGNCLYACRFCNRSRAVTPLLSSGARLLDPALDAWAAHFLVEGDALPPAVGDPDAEATHRAYDLDDPRKVIRRRVRRELVNDRLQLLNGIGAELAALLDLAERLYERRDFGSAARALREIREIRASAQRACEDLKRYRAIPLDAPVRCRCAVQDHHSLPPELERQTIAVPESLLAH